MFHKRTLKVFGIILGAVAIIFSIILFDMDVGSYESNAYYGGDAYTGMQQASAQAANNVMYTGEMLRFGFGALLLLHGLILLMGSLCIKTKAEKTVCVPAFPTANTRANDPATPPKATTILQNAAYQPAYARKDGMPSRRSALTPAENQGQGHSLEDMLRLGLITQEEYGQLTKS